MDTSIGVSQIKISVAKLMEDEGYMPRIEAKDYVWKIPIIGVINGTETMAREKALENPETNIMYAAAYLKYYQDRWGNQFPQISKRVDILATLYNQGEIRPPHSSPGSNSFGDFAKSNYAYVKKLLNICEV